MHRSARLRMHEGTYRKRQADMIEAARDPTSESGGASAERLDTLETELRATRAELDQANTALREAESLSRAAAAREAMLRSELLHRVRNMLAVVRLVFSRTVDLGRSLDEVSSHFGGRLDAIARYQTSSLVPAGGADIGTIVYDELLNFGAADDDRIQVDGPLVQLGQPTAQAFGLALHELATNSVKFGLLSIHQGALHIRWELVDERLQFSWIESGIPAVAAAPIRSGFGREYIERALPYQFNAETRFAVLPGGVSCHIDLPLRSHESFAG